MARPRDLTDAGDRQAMEETEQLLNEGRYREVVERSTQKYLELIRRRPDILNPPPPLLFTSVFPQLGVRLELAEGEEPRLVWDKERFGMAEATTYFEFTLDQLVRASRTPPDSG